jgi:alpha-1,6-mannosyltransferase
VVDTTLFFAPGSGGVRRYLLAKHVWLRGRPDLVHTLLVPGERDHWEPGGQCEFRSLRLPNPSDYRLPLALRGGCRLLVALGPDLIELGDPYAAPAAARFAVRAHPAARVAFCHSDVPRLLGSRLGRAGGAFGRALLRSAYSDVDLVLAPSRCVAGMLESIGVDNFAVQPLGVDPRVFHPDRAHPNLRARLGVGPNARLLVFAGRAAPEKDLPLLCRAVERLGHPYVLVLIGAGSAAPASGRIRAIPWQRDPRALAGWLAAADALVHAGRQETFGLVALEALACGTPVACLDGGALPEIVTREVGAVAPRPDERSLAEAIASLFERPRESLRLAARRHVLEQYTWDRVLRLQLLHYARVLGRATAAATVAAAA